jgi:hypothetical protein
MSPVQEANICNASRFSFWLIRARKKTGGYTSSVNQDSIPSIRYDSSSFKTSEATIPTALKNQLKYQWSNSVYRFSEITNTNYIIQSFDMDCIKANESSSAYRGYNVGKGKVVIIPHVSLLLERLQKNEREVTLKGLWFWGTPCH